MLNYEWVSLKALAVKLSSFSTSLNQSLVISKRVASGLVIGGAIAFIPNSAATAMQVKVTPTNPKLGDTLRVIAQYDDLSINTPPQVSVGKQTYQTFLSGSNQFRALVPTTPLDKPGTLIIRATGGGETAEVTVKLRDRRFPTQSIRISGSGSDGTDREFDRVDAFKKLVTPEKFWQGAFRRPNQGAITSGYGIRRYYNGVFAKDYYHRGIDYAGAYGSPVVAPAPGRISLVGRVAEGFKLHGNTVGIDHGQGVTTIYLHLSRINVKEGDLVRLGQVIGAVGATGGVTGPHLHWGLYVNGLSVDPSPWREVGFE